MFGQQITGQAFSSQYSVVFYQSQGYKSQAFLFNILSNVTGLVCLIATWFMIDQIGRRPMLMIGGSGMAIFLFIVGGVGLEKHPNDSERGALVSYEVLPLLQIRILMITRWHLSSYSLALTTFHGPQCHMWWCPRRPPLVSRKRPISLHP